MVSASPVARVVSERVTTVNCLERKVRVTRVVIQRVTILDSLERKMGVTKVVIQRDYRGEFGEEIEGSKGGQ